MPKVLIIDDEPGTIQMLSIYLKIKNFEIVSSLMGNEGLILAQVEAPDIILLDMMLPDISGDEVCKTLRKDPLTANVPVIVISAHAVQSIQDQALAAGANLYMTKPLRTADLLKHMNGLLGL